MAKQQRIDHFNNWPEAQEFTAEKLFKQRVQQFLIKDLFFPYLMPQTQNADIHISVSYLLDAVDSLPFRPDHAFDWTWRAFEYLVKKSFPAGGSITETLRNNVAPCVGAYFSVNQKGADAYFDLLDKIPMQTCEYLLKRIIDGAPYTFLVNQHKNLSSYAKRLLFQSGNPPVVSADLQTALDFLASNYNYSVSTERRKGASLLRKLIRREKLSLGSSAVQLSQNDVVFFVLSGLGYAFRNDRAHAKSIAPFRSSTATLNTYAHCWFMFLLIYETLFIILHTSNSPVQLNGCVGANFDSNNKAFVNLFGSHLGA